jgi:hypothetical protein
MSAEDQQKQADIAIAQAYIGLRSVWDGCYKPLWPSLGKALKSVEEYLKEFDPNGYNALVVFADDQIQQGPKRPKAKELLASLREPSNPEPSFSPTSHQ